MPSKDSGAIAPSIDSLVTDIYGLFSDPEKIDFSDHLFEQFGKELSGVVAARFKPRAGGNYLRMSNIGRPDRQLWYDINSKEDKETFAPHTLIKFLYGDMIEQLILVLAKQAGHRVENEQAEVEIDGIKGHLDATIDGCVVDVKSASSFSFEKFRSGALLEEGNDPFGYVAQLAGYVHAVTPGKDGYFLAVDKTLGKITLLRVPSEVLQQYQVKDRIVHIKEVVASKEVPPRCHPPKPDGKSGNFILSTGCGYCPHKEYCWADANSGKGLITYSYSNGPRFFTHVEKEPRVDRF